MRNSVSTFFSRPLSAFFRLPPTSVLLIFQQMCTKDIECEQHDRDKTNDGETRLHTSDHPWTTAATSMSLLLTSRTTEDCDESAFHRDLFLLILSDKRALRYDCNFA